MAVFFFHSLFPKAPFPEFNTHRKNECWTQGRCPQSCWHRSLWALYSSGYVSLGWLSSRNLYQTSRGSFLVKSWDRGYLKLLYTLWQRPAFPYSRDILDLICLCIDAQSSTRSSRSKEVTHVHMLKVAESWHKYGRKMDSLSLSESPSESQFIVDACKARSDIYLNTYTVNGNSVNSDHLHWAAKYELLDVRKLSGDENSDTFGHVLI